MDHRRRGWAGAVLLSTLMVVPVSAYLVRVEASPQDAPPQTKDGQVKAKSGTDAQKDGRVPAVAVQMTLKLYDGAGDPFLTAIKPVPKGINAFDALRAVLNVEFTTFVPNLGSVPPFPGGPMVDGLAGVRSAPPRYWILYVDGKSSQVGIGAIKIEKDTLIEWKLEEFKNH